MSADPATITVAQAREALRAVEEYVGVLGARPLRRLSEYVAQQEARDAGERAAADEHGQAVACLEELVEHVPEWSRLEEPAWSSQRLAADCLERMGEPVSTSFAALDAGAGASPVPGLAGQGPSALGRTTEND